MDKATVVDHPLVQHKLTLLRQKDRSTKDFRELLNEIGTLLCYEVTRDLPLQIIEVETPLAKMKSPVLAGKKLVFVPVVRAGLGLLEGMLQLIPSARVAHIGLYRDPRTLGTVEYFFKVPDDMAERMALLLQPVLATGNSAVAAVDRLKEAGAREVRIVCVLSTAAALNRVRERHSDVRIWTAAIDEGINEQGYILPGLGDVGDRVYGTR